MLPLAISVICVSLLYSFYQIQTERRNLRNDLTRRAATLADSLQDSIESANGQTTNRNVQRIVARLAKGNTSAVWRFTTSQGRWSP